jgi:hypothetical protein
MKNFVERFGREHLSLDQSDLPEVTGEESLPIIVLGTFAVVDSMNEDQRHGKRLLGESDQSLVEGTGKRVSADTSLLWLHGEIIASATFSAIM